MSHPATPAESASELYIDDYWPPGDLRRYGGDQNGVYSSAAAFEGAIRQWYRGGAALYAPTGRWLIDQKISALTSDDAIFTQGFVLRGDGMARTVLDVRVADGFFLEIGAHVDFKFQLAVKLQDLHITSLGRSGGGGVRLRRCFQTLIENVWISNLGGDLLNFPVVSGDGDGCNQTAIRGCRLEAGRAWAVNVDAPGPVNEDSFLTIERSFFRGNGTASRGTGAPTSGALKYKGQMLSCSGVAFAENENVGLYIPGGPGLTTMVDLQKIAFENNRGMHVYCTGVDNFKARSLNLYSNDQHRARFGMRFDGSTATVRNVDIDGVIVRASARNDDYTAFAIGGRYADRKSCPAPRHVSWQNFDYAGQRRMVGFQHAAAQRQCRLDMTGSEQLALRPYGWGNKMPLKLRGGEGGTPSSTGEWVEVELAAAGVVISNKGLAPEQRYHCYFYDDNGIERLELSTVASHTDPESGETVRKDDGTKLYVGSCVTDARGRFASVTAPFEPS